MYILCMFTYLNKYIYICIYNCIYNVYISIFIGLLLCMTPDLLEFIACMVVPSKGLCPGTSSQVWMPPSHI